MKIKQLVVAVIAIAAAWSLMAASYVADLIHGEVLILVVAAVATLTMVVALVAALVVALQWFARHVSDRQAAELARQSAELVQQRVELAAHSARMQAIGADLKTTMQDNTQKITDKVLAFDHIYGLGIAHKAIAGIDAARSRESEIVVFDDTDGMGTGPFSAYNGGRN